MYRKNEERYQRIKDLRESGYTIKQIADQTGIARSSVGYYTKKLAAEGITRKSNRHYPERKFSALQIFVANELLEQFLEDAYKMWNEGKYRDITEMADAIDSIEKITSKYIRIIEEGDYPLLGSEVLSALKTLANLRARE